MNIGIADVWQESQSLWSLWIVARCLFCNFYASRTYFLDAFSIFLSMPRQEVTHHGLASQEFADASVRSNEQKGGSYSRRFLPSLPNPPPFSLPLYPLFHSTPATQATLLLTIRSWTRNAADINLQPETALNHFSFYYPCSSLKIKHKACQQKQLDC